MLSYAESIELVVLDIEGTICPISFVHDVLFPFFVNNLDKFILNPSPEIQDLLDQVPSDDKSEYLKNLVLNDVKDPVLKKLQGIVWLEGYESGDLKCPIFQDVIDILPEWFGKFKIYIYSSGSVAAQKLLLKYNESGIDLNQYISDYFDTVNIGSKLTASSYEKILSSLQKSAAQILFLTDNLNELTLSREAGINCELVARPGNKAVEYAAPVTRFDNLL